MKKQIFYLFIWLVFPIQAQWTLQDSGTTENLNDVYCISADTVVVVGDNGTILRTTNGGSDWLPVSNPATGNLHQVQFIDAQTGYAAGDNGTLLKSTDGGASWQILNTNTTENLLALSVVDSNTLYLGGTNGLIIKTVDGGSSWLNINSNTVSDIYEILFFDNIGYFMDGHWDIGSSEMYKTIDNGNNWENINNSNVFSSFVFDNQNIGIIGGFASLQITSDACSSFTQIDLSFGCSIFNIERTNNDIWSLGKMITTTSSNNYNEYIIIKTAVDSAFQSVYLFTENLLNDIDFWDNQTGYVVGYDIINNKGLILKNINGTNTNDINIIENSNLKIFPNPSNGKINLQNKDHKISLVSYSIIDLQGKEVIPEKELTGNTINATQLPDGSYILRLKDNNNNYYTQKLIIQK